jgi:hypothetical protein
MKIGQSLKSLEAILYTIEYVCLEIHVRTVLQIFNAILIWSCNCKNDFTRNMDQIGFINDTKA